MERAYEVLLELEQLKYLFSQSSQADDHAESRARLIKQIVQLLENIAARLEGRSDIIPTTGDESATDAVAEGVEVENNDAAKPVIAWWTPLLLTHFAGIPKVMLKILRSLIRFCRSFFCY